ncbi:MAG: hypothetical protein COB49_11800 [Alphaproteobacteria bacterium]|nr:MAG: hypothetical protein COB49_11800 [Alphaproteobacteria bacterium]
MLLTILLILFLLYIGSVVDAFTKLPLMQKIGRSIFTVFFWVAMGPPLVGVAIFLLLTLYDHYAQTNTADQFMEMVEHFSQAMKEFNASRSSS